MSPKPTRAGRLVRISRLAEDRAGLALDAARAEANQAAQDLDAARGARDAVLAARDAPGAQSMDVERYRLALLLDAAGAEAVAQRTDALDSRKREQEAANAALEHTHRRHRATTSRDARQRLEEADRTARKEYDEMLDLWVRGGGRRT